MKSHLNNYLKYKKIYNLKIKNKENYNNKNISNNKSPNDSSGIIKNSKENKKNDNSEYSNENSEDINYISSPYLKDKILSPGDDDICIPKHTSQSKDNCQGNDDICLNNIFKSMPPNNNNNKKILILDLDETLVHSSFLPLRNNKNNNKMIEPDIFLKIFFDKKYYDVYVLTRPYMYEFLNDMSKLFIIYIFTASVKEYANPLLNVIDKNNIISKRLYRDSCTLNNDGKYVKNLNIFNYNLKDVILIDNNPISYSFNKENGIPIKSWHNDKNDKELLKMRNFLNFLSSVDDVRYYISKVVENDEISFYKVNTIIAKEININKEGDINYKKNKRKIRKNSFHKNYSVINNKNSNITPHKKINFNKNENTYSKIFSRTEIYNNSGPINYRDPHPKNFFRKINKNKSPVSVNSNINHNNFKININSINFNLVNRKTYKRKLIKNDINNQNMNNFKLLMNNLDFEKNLNDSDEFNKNKDFLSKNIKNNNTNSTNNFNASCYSYNKDKKNEFNIWL